MKNRVRFISTLTAMIVCISLLLAGVASGSAPDVADHWAKAQVSQWMDMGLVRGYEDGSFKPDNNITRAEFFTLVNQAFGYTDKPNTAFSDVAPTAWYAEQVARAVKVGYVAGYGDGTIKPESPISRQEAAVVLARILNLDTDAGAKSLSFADAANIPAWSRGAVGAAAAAGYIRGYEDNTFRPTNSITRAESVVMLSRAVGELVNTAGVFGSADERTVVAGNLTVSVADVTLRNVEVQGNLYITEGVGDGDVTLDNVTVAGRTLIKGGGPNSIIIRDSNMGETVIDKSDGDVRIVALGDSRIALVIVNSGARLEEGAGLTGDGFGDVTIIELPPDAVIEFSGHFSNVTVDAPANVVIASGSVGNLTVGDGAEGSSIDIGQGAGVENLTANAGASVTGSGSVGKATINANGVTMDQTPRELDVADGVDDVSVGTGSPPALPPGDSPDPVPVVTSLAMSAVDVEADVDKVFTMPVNVRGTVVDGDKANLVRFYGVISGLDASDISLESIPGGTPAIVTDATERGYAGAAAGDLVLAWGPSGGFPLGGVDYSGTGATTNFEATIKKAGTYTVRFVFYDITNGKQLNGANEEATITVKPITSTLVMSAGDVEADVDKVFTMPVNVRGTVVDGDKANLVRFYGVISGLDASDISLESIPGGTPAIVTDATERGYAGAAAGDLVLAWGPSGGFPLGGVDYSGTGATTNFEATIKTAGTYTVRFVFYDITNEKQLNGANEKATITVKPVASP